jgi:sugar-specific transcriptional regulator TrmB
MGEGNLTRAKSSISCLKNRSPLKGVMFKPYQTLHSTNAMVESEKILRFFRELGLTDYEARTYQALVYSGPSTASVLGRIAEVPYSRIYDILSKLEQRGWVESRSGRPTLYRARPPAEVIRLLKSEQERRFREISEFVIKELEPVYEKKAEMRRPDIWVLRGEASIKGKIMEMLARTQFEILISGPKISRHFAEISEISSLQATRNINLRVITSERGKVREKLRAIPNVEIRFREPLFGGGIIVDESEVLLILAGEGEYLGIWSNEVGLTKFAKEYFEYLWKDSKRR